MNQTPQAEWTETKLGDIGDALIGLTYDPGSVRRSGTLVLRSSNIQDGALAFDDNVYVDCVIPERIRVRDRDILICVRNGSRRLIGKSAMLDERVEGETFGAFMAVFRSDTNSYLRYFFQSADFKRQIDEHLGATINQITNGSLKSFVAVLPPEPERAAIVERLDDADDLIARLGRLIGKKDAMRHGMMQELLTGKTRLPGYVRAWQPRRLSELLKYEQPTPYLVRTTTQLERGRTPVLTAGKSFVLGFTNEIDGVYRAHPVIIFDDFTTASKFVDFDFKAKSSAMKILSARPRADVRFVYERMQLIDFPIGDHKRYWISEYSHQVIDAPDQEEQAAISNVLGDAASEIEVLRQRHTKAKAIKQGMMQELLAGRTRLPLEAAA